MTDSDQKHPQTRTSGQDGVHPGTLGSGPTGQIGKIGVFGAPEPPEPDPYPEHASPAVLAQMRLAVRRRHEAGWIGKLYWFLVAVTVYFFWLNLYVLWTIEPKPFHLVLESNRFGDGAPAASLRLVWDDMADVPTGEDVVHPLLSVDGAKLVPDSPDGTSADVSAGVLFHDAAEVAVNFPPRVTPGRHTGTLTLHIPGADLTTAPSSPVVVDVTDVGGRVWFILRTWLIFAVLLLVGIYVLCVQVFPTPRGAVTIARSLMAMASSGDSFSRQAVVLKLKPVALLLPWRRSRLSLSAVLDEGGLSSQNSPEGTLWFTDDRHAPVLIIESESKSELGWRELSQEKPDPANTQPVRRFESMAADREYVFQDKLTQSWVSFGWSREVAGE
ncbi:MAG: hypothetical protein ABIF77_07015 [bacterium]